MLASFNRRRRMKAESRQIPQKLAARLKFVCCLSQVVSACVMRLKLYMLLLPTVKIAVNHNNICMACVKPCV